MSDLIDQPEPGQNAPEFSVSEISNAVKRMIEGEFSHVRIRGEIGRVNRYASGHIYYDLKDEGAVLNAVTWKGQASKLSVQPEEGMEVIAVGKTYIIPEAIQIPDECDGIAGCWCWRVDGDVGEA